MALEVILAPMVSRSLTTPMPHGAMEAISTMGSIGLIRMIEAIRIKWDLRAADTIESIRAIRAMGITRTIRASSATDVVRALGALGAIGGIEPLEPYKP